jgi:single-strand DNA-binding protein
MATLNKIQLMGRLTNDPENAALPSGTRVVKFRFAVGRSRKNPQTGQWENDPNPLYIDCEAYTRQDQRRDLVNLIQQYCRKGDPLYLEGRLQLDQWDDKATGQKRSKHKIVVDNIEFLGGNRGEGGGGNMGGGGGARPPMGGGSRGGNNYGPPPDDYGPDAPDMGGPPAPMGGGEDIPF